MFVNGNLIKSACLSFFHNMRPYPCFWHIVCGQIWIPHFGHNLSKLCVTLFVNHFFLEVHLLEIKEAVKTLVAAEVALDPAASPCSVHLGASLGAEVQRRSNFFVMDSKLLSFGRFEGPHPTFENILFVVPGTLRLSQADLTLLIEVSTGHVQWLIDVVHLGEQKIRPLARLEVEISVCTHGEFNRTVAVLRWLAVTLRHPEVIVTCIPRCLCLRKFGQRVKLGLLVKVS